jgi:bifunctional UDP-N-acetylglucosamine pyrophosphorylase/glucosamine-1-phosphate N-acetyltransferase
MHEAAVIMAAGKGTRMQSELPKVCHRAADHQLVEWVVRACRDAGIERIVVVVGYGRELVRAALAGYDVEFAVQEEQLGTGHAAMQAHQVLGDEPGRMFVFNGDMPLLDVATIERLRTTHLAHDAEMTLASMVPAQPYEYGRVIHGADGYVVDIVEERDCTPAQRVLRELNVGMYVFNRPAVWRVFAELGNANKAGEYYITDMARHCAQRGGRVVAVEVDEETGLGVNTVEQLAHVEELLLARQTV